MNIQHRHILVQSTLRRKVSLQQKSLKSARVDLLQLPPLPIRNNMKTTAGFMPPIGVRVVKPTVTLLEILPRSVMVQQHLRDAVAHMLIRWVYLCWQFCVVGAMLRKNRLGLRPFWSGKFSLLRQLQIFLFILICTYARIFMHWSIRCGFLWNQWKAFSVVALANKDTY